MASEHIHPSIPWGRLRWLALWLVVVALGCRGDGETVDSEQDLPVGEVVEIELFPSALLLDDLTPERPLELRAYDEDGQRVSAEGLELEWVNVDEQDIELVVDGDTRASVARNVDAGSSVIVVRSSRDPELLSNPVLVRAAVLHPEAVALDDADILFPPPNLRPGQPLEELADYAVGEEPGEFAVGSFELTELLVTLNTRESEAGADNRLRYPVVIRGEAYRDGMSRIVGAQSSPVAGNIIAHEVRGDWVALLVEAGAPGELYERLDISFDGPALLERGLLDLDRLTGSPVAEQAQPAPAGFRNATATAIPIPLRGFNVEDCASGEFTGARVTGFAPTISPSFLPPQGEMRVDGFRLEYLRAYGGANFEIFIRPELDIQAQGKLAINCYIGPRWSGSMGISAFTGSLLDFNYIHQPRLDMEVEIGAGPRVNAFALLACNVRATMGLRYEDGRWYGRDPQAGQYNTFGVGCPTPGQPISPEVNASVTGIEFGGLGESDAGPDAYIDAKAGLTSENKLAIQLGGAIMANLQRVVAAAAGAEAFLERMRKRVERLQQSNPMFSIGPNRYWDVELLASAGPGALRIIELIADLAEVEFIDAEFGPQLRQRVETTRKLLNEADGTYWHANQHQILGLQVPATVSIGLAELQEWVESIFPNAQVPDLVIDIEPPPFDAVAFYKGIEGFGETTHRIHKAVGNLEPSFEVGDRLTLSVPGVYGQVPAVDFTTDEEPLGAVVFMRKNLGEFRKVGELAYTGVENDFLMFEGDVQVSDEEVAAYLNEVNADGDPVNPLFTISYNRMFLIDVPGYLGGYTGYKLAQVDVDGVPQSLSATRKVGEAAEHSMALENNSVFVDQPMAVEYEVGPTPEWLTMSATSGTIDGEGVLLLSMITGCSEVGQFSHELELRFRAFNENQALLDEQVSTAQVSLNCEALDGDEMPAPAFAGTQCPAVGNEVDYLALDLELATYQNPGLLQFGVKLLPAASGICLPPEVLELPVPCDSHVDYELWKMGGSVSFNDLGLLGTPHFVWNPHYLAEGMWDDYGLIQPEPITLLSYSGETDPRKPCSDARGDLNHGPTGPIIANSLHDDMVRAFPVYQRDTPDASLPEGYQTCYDRITMYGGNNLVPCSVSTTSGALYLVIQPHMTVGNH